MEYAVICSVALLASGLTFFSGFGLGTLLLPAFALFFPVDIAVALTAVVHLLNNLFKLVLIGRHADRSVLLRFGVPAIIAAFAGAALLLRLADLPPLFRHSLFGGEHAVTPVKLMIAFLMLVFAAFELSRRVQHLAIGRRWLPLGGAISGFFGGLSGHQGALRSAFLITCGLGKEAFIATGVAIACLIDVARLAIYSRGIAPALTGATVPLLLAATAAAFAGAFAGNRLLGKMTMPGIRKIVALLLFAVAVGLALGVI